MEGRKLNQDSSSSNRNTIGAALPNHYTLKIESFSQLSEILRKTGAEKHESAVFKAAGCEWKLLLYPYGNGRKNGHDHISLYLALQASNTLPPGFKVNVKLKFTIHDQIRDKYWTIQDGRVKCFIDDKKTVRGYHQAIPLKVFKDPYTGFLVNDCCIFGAEVEQLRLTQFVHEGEIFKVMKEPLNGCFTWRIENYIYDDHCRSNQFDVCGYSWYLEMRRDINGVLSIDLVLHDCNGLLQERVYVEYKMLVKGDSLGIVYERTVSDWISTSAVSCGFSNYMTHSQLIVELQIIRISVVDDLNR